MHTYIQNIHTNYIMHTFYIVQSLVKIRDPVIFNTLNINQKPTWPLSTSYQISFLLQVIMFDYQQQIVIFTSYVISCHHYTLKVYYLQIYDLLFETPPENSAIPYLSKQGVEKLYSMNITSLWYGAWYPFAKKYDLRRSAWIVLDHLCK